MTDEPWAMGATPEDTPGAGDQDPPDTSEPPLAALKARLQAQLDRLRSLGGAVAQALGAQLDADASIAATALGALKQESRPKRRRQQVRRLERLLERLAAVEVDAAHARAREIKEIARALRRATMVLAEP